MIIEFDGNQYSLTDELSVGEAMLLFEKAKVGISELFTELLRGNPYVVATVVFLLKRRAKEAVTWESLQSANALTIKLLPDEVSAEASDTEAEGGAKSAPKRSRASRTGKTPPNDSGTT